MSSTRKDAEASGLGMIKPRTSRRPWTLVLVVLGLWDIGSGGRGVVIVLESARMVIALGCWSSRTWIDGNLMLNYDCQLKFNYAYV